MSDKPPLHPLDREYLQDLERWLVPKGSLTLALFIAAVVMFLLTPIHIGWTVSGGVVFLVSIFALRSTERDITTIKFIRQHHILPRKLTEKRRGNAENFGYR